MALGRVRIEISDRDGALLALRDEDRAVDYVTAVPAAPFRLTLKNGEEPISTFRHFDLQEGKDGAQLSWLLENGMAIHAWIRLMEDGVSFSSHVTCPGEEKALLCEYPIIGGLGDLGEGTFMAHSFATGVLIHDPLHSLAPGKGIRYAPYPESFSGASMQFYTYGCKGRGSLLFMAEDGENHLKWLNLYRQGDAMEGTLMYGYEDLSAAPSAPYPFSVYFLEGTGWQEAAARYKQWAVKQPWCAQGPIAFRPHSQWLMQTIGLCTFGINAGHDRARYIQRYHKDIGVPIFHILGPDWTNTPQTFSYGTPGGLPDWVPTRFHQGTLKAIRQAGDYFAPFEFDLMVTPHKGDYEQAKEAYQQFPSPSKYSIDGYHFHMLCPCEEYTGYMHQARDVQVVRESGADGMYYDISANNLLHICLREDHHHPVGGGLALTKGYQALYQETKDACATEKGNYVPIGTEMMNEVFLPQLDFYQARAGGRPCAALELWPFTKQLKTGQAELIPMFSYVYHEYGAVRMDGWGKLVEETGDLFYDSAAKIYLWGGVYELNYEYSPSEAIDGIETSPDEHYFPFHPRGFEYSPGRARYLRQFAALRTGAGNRYLAYGQMMDGPDLDIPLCTKQYFHYNHKDEDICAGFIDVPAVRLSAYRSCDEEKLGYAIFLVNSDVQACDIHFSISSEQYPEANAAYLLSDFDPDRPPKRELLGVIQEELSLNLSLPARKVIMIELQS